MSRNSPTKARPKSISLHPQASTFPPTTQEMMYKSSISATTTPGKMASKTPVEIGTRGTVGSLITQEIEFFSQLDLSCRDSSQKFDCQLTDMTSASTNSRPKLGSLITNPKKKKKASSRLIPNMCSTVDVAESSRTNAISGFSYRNLKADVKKFQA